MASLVDKSSALLEKLPSSLLGRTWTFLTLAVLGCVVSWYFQPRSSYPVINETRSFWAYLHTRNNFISDARKLVANAFRQFPVFSLQTDYGKIIMLSPEYIDAVNDEDKLSFHAYNIKNRFANLDTFRTFATPPSGPFSDAILRGLTRSLPKFTKALSLEMTACLSDTWSDCSEWHEVHLHSDILTWVSRLSTRIFLPELINNQTWLRISIDYTMNLFTAVEVLKLSPRFLIWPVERLLPLCRRIRCDYRAGARILAPILTAREAEIDLARREGRRPDLPDDSVEWFRNAAKGREYHATDFQMVLNAAAIHTTSDLLCQGVLNLCAHPELAEPLRQEAVDVLRKHGWRKEALVDLRLMDSFFKETQRMKPIMIATMTRRATSDVCLPSSLPGELPARPPVTIKKGEITAVSSHRMWSASSYPDPETFDAYRFLNRRQIPGLEHKSLLISTSTDHVAFSHGRHACPGRFFAANEVKVAFVHLLLKYDMEIRDPRDVEWQSYGLLMFPNPDAKIRVRRRTPEIDLEELVQEV